MTKRKPPFFHLGIFQQRHVARHVVSFTVQGENDSRRRRQKYLEDADFSMLLSNLQGGAPQVISLFVISLTIDISPLMGYKWVIDGL